MSTEPEVILPQPAACKICRGAGLDLVFSDTTPYTSHIRTEHADSLPPAAADDPLTYE